MFFSDAVVAIAITLIVLPLVDSARDLPPGTTTADFLGENAYALLAAGISFFVIGGFWSGHRRLFDRATGLAPGVQLLNLAWLATIVLLPLATVLEVSAEPGDRLGVLLYVGTMLLSLVVIQVQELLLARAGQLSPTPTRGDLASGWVAVVLMLLALLLAVAFPALSLYPLLLLVLTGPLSRLVRRRAGEGPPAAVGDAE